MRQGRRRALRPARRRPRAADPRGRPRGRTAGGTESVLLAGALGAACELAADLGPLEEIRRLRIGSGKGWRRLRRRRRPQRPSTERLPNTLNVSFVGRVGADILAALDSVAASTGAARHAASAELSPRCGRWACHPSSGWVRPSQPRAHDDRGGDRRVPSSGLALPAAARSGPAQAALTPSSAPT